MNENKCVFCGSPSEKQFCIDDISICDCLCPNCFEVYKYITDKVFRVFLLNGKITIN